MNEPIPPDHCLICHHPETEKYWYPPNLFNNKLFYYFRCKQCGSVSISPLTDQHDLDLIYKKDSYRYLKKMKPGEKLQYKFDWGKHNHRTHQVKFLSELLQDNTVNSVLDYATGSGFYLAYLREKGINGIGIEYDGKTAHLLSEKSDLNIQAIGEFEQNHADSTFDLIHFGHMLEHVPDPSKYLEWARKYTHDNTLIVIDGPVEINDCISRFAIKTGSMLRRRKYVLPSPQHLTFTHRRSQLEFFKKCGLEPVRYVIKEQDYPLSPTLFPISRQSIIQYPLSRFSIFFSNVIPGWGNIFHFVGKFRT